MSIEETTPPQSPAGQAGTPASKAQGNVPATAQSDAPGTVGEASSDTTAMPPPASSGSPSDDSAQAGQPQAVPEASVQTDTDAPSSAGTPIAGQGATDGTDGQTEAPKPSADSLPLPEALQAIDDQIRAALIMVAHGNARLSKLAGNIRFSYLQRDESRLIGERRQLKTAFQQGDSTEAELKLALQALLQKAERQAGTLLAPPVKAPAAGADTPAAPLPAERSNQIRRALREAMMSLAAAAPLHLQIELAPTFPDTEPDIMAMAARIHALHRQVLGSLKAIRWSSQTSCVLSFDDGKESREVEATFSDQGLTDLPEAYRQNPQKSAQTARPAGQGKSGQNRRGGATGARAGSRAGGAAGGSQAAGAHARAGDAAGNAAKGRPHRSRPQGEGHQPRGGADGTPAGRQQPPNRPPKGQNGNQGEPRAGGNRSAADKGRPDRRPRPGQQGSAARRAEGQDQRGNRGAGARNFPSNSAMADKLRAALGGQLNLPRSKKG